MMRLWLRRLWIRWTVPCLGCRASALAALDFKEEERLKRRSRR